MANNRSALKRVRQTEARTARNRSVKSRLKTARKAVDAAVTSGNPEEVGRRARQAASLAAKAGKNNIIHKNAVRRIQSQLDRKVGAAKA